MWLYLLLEEINEPVGGPVTLNIDSQSAIQLIKIPNFIKELNTLISDITSYAKNTMTVLLMSNSFLPKVSWWIY